MVCHELSTTKKGGLSENLIQTKPFPIPEPSLEPEPFPNHEFETKPFWDYWPDFWSENWADDLKEEIIC